MFRVARKDLAVRVLFGSQLGASEKLAKSFAIFARNKGLKVTVSSMDDGISNVSDAEQLIFLCSTYGNGEFPSNARKFWQWLETPDAKKALAGKQYSLFALGNKQGYDRFARAGQLLSSKLKELCSKELVAPVFSDESGVGGHEVDFREWLSGLWETLPCVAHGTLKVEYNITPHTGAVLTTGPSALPLPAGMKSVKVLATAPAITGHTDDHVVDLDVSGLGGYALLDNVLVLPRNPRGLVERAAARLGVNLADVVRVDGTENGEAFVASVADILSSVVDLSMMPSRSMLELFAWSADSKREAAELTATALDMSGQGVYAQTAATGVWTVIDVLEAYPSVSMSLAGLLTYCHRITPRSYSIVSSPLVAPGIAKLLVKVVRRAGANGRAFNGLASGFIESLKAGDEVTLAVQPGQIQLASPTTPVFGIALGTGIGPFRAIVEHRAALAHAAREKGGETASAVSPVTLLYSFRHMKENFYFEKELRAWQLEGLVDLQPIASHDQAELLTPLTAMAAQPGKVRRVLADEHGMLMYCGLRGPVQAAMLNGVAMALDAAGASELTLTQLRCEGRLQEEGWAVSTEGSELLQGGIDVPGESPMLCFQCEQTACGTGCTKVGVCGKTPEVSALQDITIHQIKVLGWYAHKLRTLAAENPAAVASDAAVAPLLDAMYESTLDGLFATLTNVNFDADRFLSMYTSNSALIDRTVAAYVGACAKVGVAAEKPNVAALPTPAQFAALGADGMRAYAKEIGVVARFVTKVRNKDAASLCEMLLYGLKGTAAYAAHAMVGGKRSEKVIAFIYEALAFLCGASRDDLGAALQMCMRCGEANFETMGLLYSAHKDALGVPRPTQVKCAPSSGKAILVSGHDNIALDSLLKAVAADNAKAGPGAEPIKVYTHGEMLPAHSYPQLADSGVLAGHFGSAWNRQSVEFPFFHGPIVMTTNCLTEPQEEYRDTIFTMGVVGWSAIKHLGDTLPEVEWAPVIAAARAAKGYTAADTKFGYEEFAASPLPPTLMVGFGHEAIIANAGTILEAVKAGEITRFHVIGGCDGFEGTRSYYTDLVKSLPKTSVVLTLGCGKFRVNSVDMGTIGDTGIPRILDVGQCNDTFSAIQVALALAGALGCGVGDLPLSLTLSWFEQKAVAVLLSCIFLGLKPIRVGPALPAWLTPAVLDVLVKQCGIVPLGDAAADAKKMSEATAMS